MAFACLPFLGGIAYLLFQGGMLFNVYLYLALMFGIYFKSICTEAGFNVPMPVSEQPVSEQPLLA